MAISSLMPAGSNKMVPSDQKRVKILSQIILQVLLCDYYYSIIIQFLVNHKKFDINTVSPKKTTLKGSPNKETMKIMYLLSVLFWSFWFVCFVCFLDFYLFQKAKTEKGRRKDRSGSAGT